MTASLNDTDEIALAEARVAEQRAELTRSLRAASQSGQKFAQKLSRELKPAVTATLVVGGAVVALGLGALLVRRLSRRDRWRAPAQPSALMSAAKAAGVWALRLAARRAAQQIVSRLSHEGAPALVAPPPNQVEG